MALPAALLLPLGAWAQAGPFTLSGKLGSLGPPAAVYVTYQANHQNMTDSCTLKNGVFRLSGRVDGPQQVLLVTYHHGKGAKELNQDVARIWLEPGTIILNSPDSLRKARISGSRLNADQAALRAALKANDAKWVAFYKTNGYPNPEKPQPAEVAARYTAQSDALTCEKKAIERQFIKAHPATLISLFTLRSYGVPKGGTIPDVADVEPLFNGLSAEVRNTLPGKEYQASLRTWKVVGIGSVAPGFTLNNPEGQPVALADFKGQYVLLDFWASWCHPCRAENPNMVKLYERYKREQFTVLGVSLDDEKQRAAWVKAIKADGLTWPQVYDPAGDRKNAAVIRYGVQSIPENFLIDPAGKIIARNLKGEALAGKLKELFDKP